MRFFSLRTSSLVAAAALVALTGCANMAGSDRSYEGAPQRTAGEVIDDARIVSELKAKFAADSDLSAFKINIDSTAGDVRLRGEVKTLAARQKAEQMARDLKGVKSVSNQLMITG